MSDKVPWPSPPMCAHCHQDTEIHRRASQARFWAWCPACRRSFTVDRNGQIVRVTDTRE